MKKRIIFFYLFLWLFLSMALAAHDYTCEKWSVLDIRFETSAKIKNPFEIRLGAVIVHESGETVDVPGFYNGENGWNIRFSPPIEGSWSFTTYSSVPDLAGRQGRITVNPCTKSNEHGPIVISKENSQKFHYADGTPYFLLAVELDWLFALDWGNPTDIPKTRSIVTAIADNGFNQIIMNVYAYDASWGEKEKIRPEHNFAAPDVFPFGGSNESPDYSTLNIDFFNHLDRVIAHLDEKEIIAHLMIYVWNKKVNWPQPNSKADNMYFDYVVKRYQAFPNLVWDISKEALGYGRDDMNYITDRIERLRKLDGHKRLLSVHDYQYCSAFPDKVDFISIQQWVPNIYDEMRRVKLKHADKPIFNIEHGGYEKSMHSIFDGAYTNPIVCLDRNYQIVFAGAYSTYYWQNAAWYEVVFNPFELPAVNQPKFVYYKYLSALFKKYDFGKLEPAQFGFTTYCLTDHQTHYLFYLHRGMIKIAGDVKSLKGKTVQLTWFNPINGVYYPAETRKFNGTWISFAKPEAIESPIAVAILEVTE